MAPPRYLSVLEIAFQPVPGPREGLSRRHATLCPRADFFEGHRLPDGATPVQRESSEMPCKTAIESGLAHVTLEYRPAFWPGHAATVDCDLAFTLQ